MTRVPFDAMKGQGQSVEATIDKERCLGSALTIGCKIASKFSATDFAYWHFDANAGCGHNDICDVPGSPIVFHVTADACLNGMQRRAFFCDHDKAALKELLARLNGPWRSSSFLLAGDNEEALALFAECIRNSGERPSYAIGSVIVDPNGYWYRDKDGNGAPIKGLLKFAAEFSRIDIILNLNTRSYRLNRAHKWGSDVLPPREVLASLHKNHWLIKRTHRGGNEWLLAVGRNIPTGDHLKLGFHKLESEAGHEIMTIVEGGRQGDLDDVAI